MDIRASTVSVDVKLFYENGKDNAQTAVKTVY